MLQLWPQSPGPLPVHLGFRPHSEHLPASVSSCPEPCGLMRTQKAQHRGCCWAACCPAGRPSPGPPSPGPACTGISGVCQEGGSDTCPGTKDGPQGRHSTLSCRGASVPTLQPRVAARALGLSWKAHRSSVCVGTGNKISRARAPGEIRFYKGNLQGLELPERMCSDVSG